MFVALGTGLLLLNYIGSSLLYGWLFSSMRSIGASTWATSSLLRIVQSGISAVAFAFLIAAAFVDRILACGPEAFILFKTLGIGICVAFLTVTKNFKAARIGLAVVLGGYSLLLAWHLLLLATLLFGGPLAS